MPTGHVRVQLQQARATWWPHGTWLTVRAATLALLSNAEYLLVSHACAAGTTNQHIVGVAACVLPYAAGASIQSAWLSGRALADRLAALRGKGPEQAQQLAIGLQDPFVPLSEATGSAAEIGEFPGCKVPAAAAPPSRQQRQGQPQQQQQRQGQQQERPRQAGAGGRGPRQQQQQQRQPAQQQRASAR